MKRVMPDTVDKIILNILQEDAKTPLKEIADKVYLSVPAISARIEKMEKEGLITGYHAQVNPMALGYHIKALVNLEVPPEDKKIFYPFVKACPNVIECNGVTGDYSMVLEVLFPSTVELDHFIGTAAFWPDENPDCFLHLCGASGNQSPDAVPGSDFLR